MLPSSLDHLQRAEPNINYIVVNRIMYASLKKEKEKKDNIVCLFITTSVVWTWTWRTNVISLGNVDSIGLAGDVKIGVIPTHRTVSGS